jgi:hypothetical protein
MDEQSLNDAIIQARENVEQRHKEWVGKYYAPVVNVVLKQAWRQQSPQTLELLRQTAPGVVKNLDKQYGGNNGSD